MNDERIQNIPLILETPSFEAPKEVWAREIAILQRLSATVTNSAENQDVLCSIIGDARDDEMLVDVIKNAVKIMEGSKTVNTGNATGKRGKKEC